MAVVDIDEKRKLQILFTKFSQVDYVICGYYVDNLIKHLSENNDGTTLIEDPDIVDLVTHSIEIIDKCSESVEVFLLKAITILFRNENIFNKIIRKPEYKIFTSKFCNQNLNAMPPKLQKAYIELVTAQLCHPAGILWIVDHKVWNYILPKEISVRPTNVARTAYNFMARLVWKLDETSDETNLLLVLKYIVNPILERNFPKLTSWDDEKENNVIRIPMMATFYTINHIIDLTEEFTNKNSSQNRALFLLSRYCTVECPIHLLLEVIRDPVILTLLTEIAFKIFVYLLVFNKDHAENKSDSEVGAEITIHFYNYVHLFIRKRSVTVLLDTCIKCNKIWSTLGSKMAPGGFVRYGRPFTIENQLLAPLLPALLMFIFGKSNKREEGIDDQFEVYFIKLMKLQCEQMLKACYSFRELIKEFDIKEVAIEASKRVAGLKGYLTTEQAGTMYQAMFYMLQYYISGEASHALTLSDCKLISNAVEGTKMLLLNYNIHWYENCEIVSLHNVLIQLLKQNELPSKLQVQVMDLVDIGVKKFLSPDLALLVESKSGSTLCEMTKIIAACVKHAEWEVRESALCLLLTCTDIAFVKYTPFQKLISEQKLILLAAHAALNDAQFYVQATALKCVAAASKIVSLWQELIEEHKNIHCMIYCILVNSPEGIVRKEAVNALADIYVNRVVTASFVKNMNEAMTTTAITDLHWEVQLAALKFWRIAIKNEFSYHGMIDGKFPAVTFSREKRKIITLDQREIERKLDIIMNNLSNMGCLTVLHRCLNEDFNIAVMEEAYLITKELLNILDEYNFQQCVGHNIDTVVKKRKEIGGVDDELKDALDLTKPNDRRESVIDDIVGTSQSDLITTLYENYVEENKTKPERTFELIQSNVFLRDVRKNNYYSKIERKKIWNSGATTLDSILEEVLSIANLY